MQVSAAASVLDESTRRNEVIASRDPPTSHVLTSCSLATARFNAALAFVDISGFTALSETLAHAHGAEGAELLQSYTNVYLEKLISAVQSFGGDILKFGGDAFIARWCSGDEGEPVEIIQLMEHACACCLALLCEFDHFEVDLAHPGSGSNDSQKAGSVLHLRLHAGVAAGEVSEFILGKPTTDSGFGLETLVAGPVVARLGEAVDAAAAGELVISPVLDSHPDSHAAYSAASNALGLDSHSELLSDGSIRISYVRRENGSPTTTRTGDTWLVVHPYVVALRGAQAARERQLEQTRALHAKLGGRESTGWREFLPEVLRRQLPAGEATGGTARQFFLSEHRSLSALSLRRVQLPWPR